MAAVVVEIVAVGRLYNAYICMCILELSLFVGADFPTKPTRNLRQQLWQQKQKLRTQGHG